MWYILLFPYSPRANPFNPCNPLALAKRGREMGSYHLPPVHPSTRLRATIPASAEGKRTAKALYFLSRMGKKVTKKACPSCMPLKRRKA